MASIGSDTPYPRRKYSSKALSKLAESDRKSTRLNSSHLVISYAVFCLKKKKKYDEVVVGRTTEVHSALVLDSYALLRGVPVLRGCAVPRSRNHHVRTVCPLVAHRRTVL